MGEEIKKVIAYTDGACIGNPGPGGYAAVLLHGSHRKELSGGFRMTTNNRMEVMAAIIALRALRGTCSVTLYTDSQYLADAIMKGWAKSWRARGWRRKKKGKALNPDLWADLLELCEKHEVEFLWIRGHAGNKENERCDVLSMQAASQKDLPPDNGYDQPDDHAPDEGPSLLD
jgi:ribonuclease HI